MNREDTRNFALCPGGHFISFIWQGGMTTAHLKQKTLLFGCMSPMLSSVILGRMSCRRVSRFVEGCGASIDILLSCHTGGNVGIFRRLSTGRYH